MSDRQRRNRLRSQRLRKRSLRLESLERRQLMAADSIGVTPQDNGEFLAGKVVVTPVFFESNGAIDTESQDWDGQEIQDMLAKIDEGVNWWTRLLDSMNTVHTLEFVVDDKFATTPFETSYEPIDRSSGEFTDYVSEFLVAQGLGNSPSIEAAVHSLNHSQRIAYDADWSFTIFVADSSDDLNGQFASGGFGGAFAYPGGLFMVTPSSRPASTITHEMGHIFWARDEYQNAGSWTDTRGYYNASNLNAWDNPTPGFVQDISIMRGGIPLGAAYDALYSPESTLAMVGWRDSDGDGIFDFADVPLQLSGTGTYDPNTELYSFQGAASAVPLRNLNSSGHQSDITLNQVSRLEYRVDGGDWQMASELGGQNVDLDVQFSVSPGFQNIELRVVDTEIGVTSEIVSGTLTAPAISAAAISVFAFEDSNRNGQRDTGESLLPNRQIALRRSDGSALFKQQIQAGDLQEGELPVASSDEVKLSADGFVSESTIGVFSVVDDGPLFFHSYDLQRERWTASWSDRVALVADLPEVVGEVRVGLRGAGSGSYGRVEAYDLNGALIGRTTSPLLADGETGEVVFSDPLGQISQVKVFGHAETSVYVESIDVGHSGQGVTDDFGVTRFENLPEGSYELQIAPSSVVEQFQGVPSLIQVAAGVGEAVAAAAVPADSPRLNAANPYDVNESGDISSLDALLVINDISRRGSRELEFGETEGFKVDVNNDGRVTALDALLVINRLDSLQDSNEAESEWMVGTGLSTQVTSTEIGFDSLAQERAPLTASPLSAEQADAAFGQLATSPETLPLARSGNESAEGEWVVPGGLVGKHDSARFVGDLNFSDDDSSEESAGRSKVDRYFDNHGVSKHRDLVDSGLSSPFWRALSSGPTGKSVFEEPFGQWLI